MSRGPRIFVDKEQPSVHKALGVASGECRARAEEAGLTRATLELVNVRCSQINGCAYCLDLHTRLALREGITAQQLGVLPAWHDTQLFEPRDRAALALAEAVTGVAADPLTDEEYAEIRTYLSEAQLAVLVYAASIINAFNRISILSKHPVTHREPRPD